MFPSNIGTRTGRNVLEGKVIHCDSAGFDNFEDYFTDSASSSPEKTIVETERQNEIKSFLNAEKSVYDGDSPLSKLSAKKRLSFKSYTVADSDSSSINLFQPRNRFVSKRGMQSFPGEEEEEEEKKNLEQFSASSVSGKSYSLSNKVYISAKGESKHVQRISKRGMKSFPDDDDDDVPVYEIVNSSDNLSPETVVRGKTCEDEPQNLLSNGGKENKGSRYKIQNDEKSQKLRQNLSSHVSPSSIKTNPTPVKRHSLPIHNWYLWEDSSSLIDRAKMIITPYGVHEDTGVKKNFQNLGTNLQVIEEDDSQQKNWNSKLIDTEICENSNLESASEKEQRKMRRQLLSKIGAKKTPQKKDSFNRMLFLTNEDQSSEPPEAEKPSPAKKLSGVKTLVKGKKKSLSKIENESETDLSKSENSLKISTYTNMKGQKLNKGSKAPELKFRVSPRRQKTDLRKTSSPIRKEPSPLKKRFSSTNSKSPQVGKDTTLSLSNKKKQSLPPKKMNQPSLPLTRGKRTISASEQNKSVGTRKSKRKASRSPEVKNIAKRLKVSNKTLPSTSIHMTRASTSNRKKIQDDILPPKNQKEKMISQKQKEVETSSEPKIASEKPGWKKTSSVIATLPRTRRTSGPVSSDDSVMVCNKEHQTSGQLHSEDSLMACIRGQRTSGPLYSEDSLVACNRGYSKRISAMKSKSPAKANRVSGAETEISLQRTSPCTFYRNYLSQLREKKETVSTKRLKEKSLKRQRSPSKTERASEFEPSSLQNASLKSVKSQSSFYVKANYNFFNSYENIKIDHKISYCVCSQSDTALVGMMKVLKGGYRKTNCSIKEMFFTVLEGQVKVMVDDEKQKLTTKDTFLVPKNGVYSIENASSKTASLIFTLIK